MHGAAPPERNGNRRLQREAAGGAELKQVDGVRPQSAAMPNGPAIPLNDPPAGIHPLDFVRMIDRQRARGVGDQPLADRRHSLGQFVEIEPGAVDILVKLHRQIESPARQDAPHDVDLNRRPGIFVLAVQIDAVIVGPAVVDIAGGVEAGEDRQIGSRQSATIGGQCLQPFQHRFDSRRFIAMDAGSDTNAHRPARHPCAGPLGVTRRADGQRDLEEGIGACTVNDRPDRRQAAVGQRLDGPFEPPDNGGIRAGGQGVRYWVIPPIVPNHFPPSPSTAIE